VIDTTTLPWASTDPEKIRGYLSDESSAMHGAAERLFLPEHAGHVSAVLRTAVRDGHKVTVSAAGTSITGARVPTCGGWILSAERMRHLAAAPEGFNLVRRGDLSFFLNPETRQAIAPVGLTLAEFNGELARYGLVYPPDPTEMTAMLGGTVATNASGARSFHYKPTRAWVKGLEVVLPDGEVLKLTRGEYRARGRRFTLETPAHRYTLEIPRGYPVFSSKNAAGLYLAEGMDLVDLFIGSEGMLGVITAVHVELEQLPADTVTSIAFFRQTDDALRFSRELRSERKALSIEYFDGPALEFIRHAFPDIPEGSAGAILFEFIHHRPDRYNPYPPGKTIAPWTAHLSACKAITDWSVTGSDVSKIKEFRHTLPEMVNAWVRERVGKLGTDMAVPPEQFPRMAAAYEAAHQCGVRTVVFGHIGDCHLHLNFLPENERELARAREKYLELARLAVSLGGTISAEHGVGKKTITDEEGRSIPYLEVMLGREGLEAIHAVKRALDPGFILNPGNMVPEGYC
jgi:D-lactate dehydrogenase (cytochrome)